MKIFSSYFCTQKILKKARLASRYGQQQEALEILEIILQSKEIIMRPRLWKSTWTIVREIFEKLGEYELLSLSNDNCFELASAHLCHDLGYELVEKGFYTVALPLLRRAALLFPDDEKILTELAYIYEHLKLYREAKECLLQSQNLSRMSFTTRYLVVFYSVMMRDLEEANDWFCGLSHLLNDVSLEYVENYLFMFKNIEAVLNRGRLLSPYTSLDSVDLLGWNAVVNGNIVLHTSEYRVKSMKGRYAFYQESPRGLLSCLIQLINVLNTLSIHPQRILSLPDRNSCVLSHIAAKFLRCSVEIFSEATKSLPGLIICYSSDLIDSESLAFLSEAAQGQVFWCHASNWTQCSIAPDFISFFAQYASPPWEERVSLEWQAVETKERENSIKPNSHLIFKERLEGSYEQIAEDLCKNLEMYEVTDIPAIKILAHLLFYGEDGKKNVFNRKRHRSRQWADSPVGSFS